MCTFGIAYYPFDKDSSRYKNRGFSVVQNIAEKTKKSCNRKSFKTNFRNQIPTASNFVITNSYSTRTYSFVRKKLPKTLRYK